MNWDLVILLGWYLAVARTTHLITSDRITEDLRIRFMHRVGVTTLLGYLVNCSWCVSIWVAAFSVPVPVYMADRTWPQAVLFSLGASYFTGLMSSIGAEDIEIEVRDS